MTGTITFDHKVNPSINCSPHIEFDGQSVAIPVDESTMKAITFYKRVNIYPNLFPRIEDKFNNSVLTEHLDTLLDVYNYTKGGGHVVIKCECEHPIICLGRVLHDTLTYAQDKFEKSRL